MVKTCEQCKLLTQEEIVDIVIHHLVCCNPFPPMSISRMIERKVSGAVSFHEHTSAKVTYASDGIELAHGNLFANSVP
jgi:hypothetical protein